LEKGGFPNRRVEQFHGDQRQVRLRKRCGSGRTYKRQQSRTIRPSVETSELYVSMLRIMESSSASWCKRTASILTQFQHRAWNRYFRCASKVGVIRWVIIAAKRASGAWSEGTAWVERPTPKLSDQRHSLDTEVARHSGRPCGSPVTRGSLEWEPPNAAFATWLRLAPPSSYDSSCHSRP
jgi:hypothetical protein